MSDGSSKPGRMLFLISILGIAWLLWSGIYTPLLLGLGAFACVLTLYLTVRMDYFDKETFTLDYGWRLLGYWAWLAKEVVRSSISVARVVISPRLPISPEVIEVKAASDNPVDQVILANSITLTPGTLALDVYKGVITVHTLTAEGAREIEAGEMNRRVAALRRS